VSSWKAGKGADQPWAGKQSTISTGGGKMGKEGAGVEYGLSSYQANMDTQQNEPEVCTMKDPLTGNPTERIKKRSWHSASHHGKTFQVEE